MPGGREVSSTHAAACEGHANILSLLLEHGSEVDGRGVVDQTPLHRASQKGNPEAGLFLLDHGADLNARNGLVALHLSLRVLRTCRVCSNAT